VVQRNQLLSRSTETAFWEISRGKATTTSVAACRNFETVGPPNEGPVVTSAAHQPDHFPLPPRYHHAGRRGPLLSVLPRPGRCTVEQPEQPLHNLLQETFHVWKVACWLFHQFHPQEQLSRQDTNNLHRGGRGPAVLRFKPTDLRLTAT
jgi:hypothetical protein